mmetsp:Transcript_51083/g.94508  ORF Transcript_51083/g.94508 Transcript_51083/m.94508 type:complete len:282 (+) Transcript_51083:318-1163(+)
MAASVDASMAAVASSRTTSLEHRNTARAIATICRCPADKFCPPSLISSLSASSLASAVNSVASPLCLCLHCSSTHDANWASSRAFQTSATECSPNGSQLYFMSAVNKTGSCGIIAKRLRKSRSPIASTSTPSKVILVPASGSTMRNKANNKEDFPAPVRPIMPRRSPPGMVTLMPFNTCGKSGLYRSFKFSMARLPAEGHASGGLTSVMVAASSSVGDVLEYSFTRSTQLKAIPNSESWSRTPCSMSAAIAAIDSTNPARLAPISLFRASITKRPQHRVNT